MLLIVSAVVLLSAAPESAKCAFGRGAHRNFSQESSTSAAKHDQSEPLETELARLANQISNTLANLPESEQDYRDRKFVDLYTSASIWIAGATFVIIAIFWITYRKELRELVSNLEKVKIGESFELVRTTVEEMKSFGEGDPEFENPAQQIAGAPLENFFSFLRYPDNKLANNLDNPFVPMNWPPRPWLRNLEARLNVSVEKLRSSSHFREDRPPLDFLETKKRLFRALVSLGNYYGFVRRNSAPNRPIDLESSMYFLRRAIDLKPEAGESLELTVGYAQFCMGAVNAMLGVDLFERGQQGAQPVPALRQEGQDLMTAAVHLLEAAAANGQRLPGRYHLKAFLLFRLGRVEEAAEAWKLAAERSWPPSSKMRFNQACALAACARYADSLNALQTAVDIVISRGLPADGFDPRAAALDPDEGAEFEPFRTGQAPAVAARSANNRSFAQIIS